MGSHVSTPGSKLSLVSVCVTDDLCHIAWCEHLPDEPRLKDLRQVEKPQGGKEGTALPQCFSHSYIHSEEKKKKIQKKISATGKRRVKTHFDIFPVSLCP